MNEIARNFNDKLTERSYNNQEGSHMSNKKRPKEKPKEEKKK